MFLFEIIFNKQVFQWFSDGKLLVAAGKSNKLHIWSIEMKNLIKIINLGTKIENIKDCVLLAGPYENKVDRIRIL